MIENEQFLSYTVDGHRTLEVHEVVMIERRVRQQFQLAIVSARTFDNAAL